MVNFGLHQRQHAAGYTCNWTVHLRIMWKAGGRVNFDGIMEISEGSSRVLLGKHSLGNHSEGWQNLLGTHRES